MASKTNLPVLIGFLLVAMFLISSEVEARELAEETKEKKTDKYVDYHAQHRGGVYIPNHRSTRDPTTGGGGHKYPQRPRGYPYRRDPYISDPPIGSHGPNRRSRGCSRSYESCKKQPPSHPKYQAEPHP